MLVQTNLMEITQQHKRLLTAARDELGQWRKFLIGVDGRDDSGKSTLARFLAWQMCMPTIETDLLLDEKHQELIYRQDDLKRLVNARLSKERPVIVEGIFLLETLGKFGFEVDYFVCVENLSFPGSDKWQSRFSEYETAYTPKEKANFVFSWKED